MSLLGKKWIIASSDPTKSFIEKILENRGLTDPDQIVDFLNAKEKKLHDPFLMKDMEKAAKRVMQAIEKNEKIAIYGDYDVDGLTGTAILVRVIEKLCGQVTYRVPHRFDDGYGVHEKYIDEFEKAGITLVITVDCGISNEVQITLARKKGIDVIITDHHTIPEQIPEAAYAILHPLQSDCAYPNKGLTGSAVAFKLAQALLSMDWKKKRDKGKNNDQEEPDQQFLDELIVLASFGLVADLGPLKDENRTLVARGLQALQRTQMPGMKHLKKIAGINGNETLTTDTIGFKISPRINAAGRIAHPYYALQLLLRNSDDRRTQQLALHLESLNEKRREMTKIALNQAHHMIESMESIPELIIADHAEWHTGILGLIAANIADTYNKPAIILQDRGDFLVSSARSPEYCNIILLLKKCTHLLDTCGGHAQAAGFTVQKKNYDAFKKMILECARKKMKNLHHIPSLTIDCEMREGEIINESIDLIEKLAPFGMHNEKPLLLFQKMQVQEVRAIGQEKAHLKIQFQTRSGRIEGIGFNLGSKAVEIKNESSLNIVGHFEYNTFQGKKLPQINIVDIGIV